MARAFSKRYAPLSSIESVKISVFVWRGAGQCVITVSLDVWRGAAREDQSSQKLANSRSLTSFRQCSVSFRNIATTGLT